MARRSAMYTADNVRDWISKYAELGSVAAVARYFSVDRNTVRKYLHIYGQEMGFVSLASKKERALASGLKECSVCKKILSISLFRFNTRSKCYACYYEKTKEWANQNKEALNRRALRRRHAYRARMCKVAIPPGKKRCVGCMMMFDLSLFRATSIRSRGGSIRLPSRCRGCLSKDYRSDWSINKRLSNNLRSRLRLALHGKVKSGSAIRDLGCSINRFKSYIESLFYKNAVTGEEMSWANYGYRGWHLDHIIPLSAFRLSERRHLLAACNYKNIQPMWGYENFKKGAQLPMSDNGEISVY